MNGLNLALRLILAAGLVLFLAVISQDSSLNNINSNLNKAYHEENNSTASEKQSTSLTRDNSNFDHFRPNALDQSTVNDPYYYKQWALSRMRAQELWQVAEEESKVVIAILDTGIDRNHEDLKGRVVAEINFTDSPSANDIYGHGTHIAGIIAGIRNNGIGIAGLASGSRLLNVKVADDQGKVQAMTVAKGIVWAADNGANIINISLTIKASSPDLEKAVNYAWARGALVISASSNENDELICYPAGYENSISVAISHEDDTPALSSNQRKNADIAAPGFNIYSTLPGNNYGYRSGTSFATAHVTGLGALLFDGVTDKNGDGFFNDDVRTAIQSGYQSIESTKMSKNCVELVDNWRG